MGERNAGLRADQQALPVLQMMYGGTSAVAGRSVCVTGTLRLARRADFEALMESLGATVVRTPTRETSFLVVGTWRPQAVSSRKFDRARQLAAAGAGIEIVGEDEFFALLAE